MQPSTSHLSHVVRRSTAEIAAESLREAIIYGELPMGTPLSEAAVAERFGISRTPVREALRLLAQEGLVELRPFVGASVFRVSRTELRQLFAFREMLETAAIEEVLKLPDTNLVPKLKAIIAQMRDALESEDSRRYLALDSEFHEAILESAHNRLLCDAYQLVASRFNALRTVIASNPARLKESIRSHVALVKIIASRDLDAARAALVKHIKGSEEMFDTDPSLL